LQARSRGICCRLSIPHRGWFALILSLCVLACGRRAIDNGQTNSQSGSQPERIVIDEIGRQVEIKHAPARIVSLAPSITETLFSLGAGDRVVGVTSYCDFPPEALSREKVGDTLRPSIEKIVALKADLVIASTASQLESFVRNLDRVGIAVYVSNPRNLEGAIQSINRIGDVIGASNEAVRLTQHLNARIAAVQSRVSNATQPRVLFLLGTTPLITVGGSSFIGDLIDRAGGASISRRETTDYPQYSLESVIASLPEVIFLQAGESGLPVQLEQTPAARSGRVYRLDENILLRPGPRIVEGLEQMAAKIHPELFGGFETAH
jgi:cobalamin transport system substrate-binding protein